MQLAENGNRGVTRLLQRFPAFSWNRALALETALITHSPLQISTMAGPIDTSPPFEEAFCE
jgi:hypothetical protein